MTSARVVEIAQRRLSEAADPAKAGPMAAYMKTEMPFYGVQKRGRTPIVRELVRTCPPASRREYEANIGALWQLDHREEKYLALGYARTFDEYVDRSSIPLFQRLVIEGAWWDLVDETAIKLVGRTLAKDRPGVTPVVEAWVVDEDLWLRRSSIICQVGHKDDVDQSLLARACEANLSDEDFFIRKAIGWALRDHARVAPDWVAAFCEAHRGELSNLSYREATKHL